MPTENGSLIHTKVVKDPDGQEVSIAYFSQAQTENAESNARIQAAAERLVQLLTRNPGHKDYDWSRSYGDDGEAIIALGTSPTAEYGQGAKTNYQGEIDDEAHNTIDPNRFYPKRNQEATPSDPEQVLNVNREVLNQIIEATMKLKNEKKFDYTADHYLAKCAEESGLSDDSRISTVSGIRLSDDRYKTLHWRCAFYPKGGNTGKLGWVTTGGDTPFHKSQRINALRAVDLTEMEEYMRQPRTPVEIADAFFKTLEQSSIAVRRELEERGDALWKKKQDSLGYRLKQKLHGWS